MPSQPIHEGLGKRNLAENQAGCLNLLDIHAAQQPESTFDASPFLHAIDPT